MSLSLLAKCMFHNTTEILEENGLEPVEFPDTWFVAERMSWDERCIESTTNALKTKVAVYLNHLIVITKQFASRGSDTERTFARVVGGFVANRFWTVHMGDSEGCPTVRGLPFPPMTIPISHSCHDRPLHTPRPVEKDSDEWEHLVAYVGHVSLVFMAALCDLRDVLERRYEFGVYKELDFD